MHPPLHTLKIWGGGSTPRGARRPSLSVCFFCPSRYDARHRKPRWCVYVLNLGGTDIRPKDSFSYRCNFRFRSRFRSRSNFRSSFSFSLNFSFSFSFRLSYRSSYVAAKATYIRLLHGKIGILEGFFGPSSVHRGRTHIVLG